jgi:biopolymer transport protein ExbD
MITWKMRHQGSPEALDGLTAEQIVEGVQEGQWEPTDEVMGPNDAAWQPLETHPHFAEVMAELEPPMAPRHPDETRLDMNPMIDVALVLLIFFILTTTYEELRKMFPAPPSSSDEVKQTIGDQQLRAIAIRVTAKQENDKTVFRVEDEIVPESDLKAKLIYWKEKSKQNLLAVEMDKNVPWKAFMAIQDAAAGAKIQETLRIERAPAKEE